MESKNPDPKLYKEAIRYDMGCQRENLLLSASGLQFQCVDEKTSSKGNDRIKARAWNIIFF